MSWKSQVIEDRQILTLLGILALRAKLRLWKIRHLFQIVHDCDEGAPTEVTVLLVVSAYYTNPGYYAFCVARIEMEDT